MSNEQSIRDELANLIPLGFREQDGVRNVVEAADRILASPVIRRIQAEAVREAAGKARHELGTEASGHTSTYSVRHWLNSEADRIERGETA